MGHKKGQDRSQYTVLCLDEMVDEDSTARIIDAFVDATDLEALGFLNTAPHALGRDSYSPAHLAKLYLYGYESAVRSSRRLERLCHVNVEAMWLMDSLTPDFKTISDFRKDNHGAFVELFSAFVEVCGHGGLIGKKFAAIDGTKIKASNAKKRNLSKRRLEESHRRNKDKALEYLGLMDAADEKEGERLLSSAREAQRRADEAEKLLEDMAEGDKREVSLTDADARRMTIKKGSVEIAYNVQASVDGRANIVMASDISQNPADADQLAHMAKKTQEAYGKKKITALADKGYYDAGELEKCEGLGVRAIVARPKSRGVKEGVFGNDEFVYDKESDSYLCPAKNILECRSKEDAVRKRYRNEEACKSCELKDRCLSKKSKWRTINRTEGAEVRDRADACFAANRVFYKKRQQTVEPVFGIVKRFMGGDYFLLRGLEKVKAEAALLFTGYNIKRARGALGFEGLMEAIERYGKAVREAALSALTGSGHIIACIRGIGGVIRQILGLCPSIRRIQIACRGNAISHTV